MELGTIVTILDVILLTIVIVGTGLLIYKLKLGSKNHVLLFILFIFYWMAPLMCREYTGQMHIHMGLKDGGWLLWLPLTIYAIAGLFWRPLTDVLSCKLQSRKKVIYISLVIQALTLWPMFAWPNLTTNIIQSIGTGVGASAIGLFNLMFTESHHKKKVFVTVSILALPPLIAEFITSALEAIVCAMVPEHGLDPAQPDLPSSTIYLDYLKWLWLVALIFVVVSFVITIFFKEERETLFKDLNFKEPIVTKQNRQVVTLVCIAGAIFAFVRWVSAGPSSVTQLIYIAMFDKMNPETSTSYFIEEVKFFEGYLSLMFALGQLAGAIIAGLALSRHQDRTKVALIAVGSFIWLIYLLTNGIVINVHMFFWSNILNGLGYGLIYPVLIGLMLNKMYVNKNIITPIGVFNTCMAGGIFVGSLFNNLIKGPVYDFHETPETSTAQFFMTDNWAVNGTTMFLIVCMVVLFVFSYSLEKKYPPMKTNMGTKFVAAGESEI
ncbi:MAG: MFS transporter [Mycoplasmoidaceae bacterium]